MNESVQQLMTKMMSGFIKPEDMPRMMDTMMGNVFKQMTKEERITFMEDMMPRCMSIMFDKLDAEARKELATTMLQRMADELKSQQNC
jgi:Mg/Co/Ni transporter MgtE